MSPPTSVVIPVYNAVRSLELVLAGYRRQTTRDFELCVADDGSGPEVPALVEEYSRSVPFPVRYVSQPDEGFRRSRVLNLAIRATSAPHLVFADADCIPHSYFVEAHSRHGRTGTVLCGRRVHLSRETTGRLTPDQVMSGELERLTTTRLLKALLGRGGHWDEGILLKNSIVHGWVNYKEPSLLGCNFSLERALLESINGFNEDFVGYGGEDTELEYRLRLAGAHFAWVRHRAIQYHLYHPPRAGAGTNLAVLEQTRAAGQAACRNGLRRNSG